MRCPDCGQLLGDGVRCCPSCGNKIDPFIIKQQEELKASTVNADEADTSTASADQQYTYNQDRPYTSYTSARRSIHPSGRAIDKPMKWYYFLIYISLFATAVINVLSGIAWIMGLQYDSFGIKDQVYGNFPGLMIVDIVYGILTVLFGLYALLVRKKLKGFKKEGPKLLLLMYGLSLLLTIVYTLVSSLVTGMNMIDQSFGMSIATTAILVGLNNIYFKKRAHLFTE